MFPLAYFRDNAADTRSNATETSLFMFPPMKSNLKYSRYKTIIWQFKSIIFAFSVVCFGISWFHFCIPDPFHIILHCFVNSNSCSTSYIVPMNALSKSKEMLVAFLSAILRFCLLYCQGKIRGSGSTTDGFH